MCKPTIQTDPVPRKPIGIVAIACARELAAFCWEAATIDKPTVAKFGGMKPDDAKRLEGLERENAALKRLLGDVELEKVALKEIAKGNVWARSAGGRLCST